MDEFALSKSSKIVLAAFLSGKITQGEILDSTGLAERTVRYAISILKERGLIIEINSMRDARKRKYYLKGGEKNE